MTREFPKNPELKIALPTVGRIVHVFGPWETGITSDTPRAGLVAGLCAGDGFHGSELRINVAVFNSKGGLVSIESLKHASLPRHADEAYWDWMDFQKGQAAKTEQLERDLGKLQAGAPSPVDGKR